MMHRLCKIALLAVACLRAVPAVAHAQGVTDTETRIGSFGPLAGANYIHCRIATNGIQAAFDKVNEASGINGRKLVLVGELDRCEPPAHRRGSYFAQK